MSNPFKDWTFAEVESFNRRTSKIHEIKTYNSGTDSIVERNPCNEPLEADKSQEGDSGRILVRFVSVRKRLCDPDNLSVKWLLDSLRYASVIPGDEPEKISLEVSQRRCAKGEIEKTEIAID